MVPVVVCCAAEPIAVIDMMMIMLMDACTQHILLPPVYDTIRYDTRCYFNVRSKADISQLNLPHGTDN